MAKEMLVSRCEGLIEAEVDGEMVALHVESGTCYGFNLTATRVWSLLERPMTLGQLCQALTSEFDVEPRDCEGEVRVLLDDLARDGLVTLSSDGTATPG